MSNTASETWQSITKNLPLVSEGTIDNYSHSQNSIAIPSGENYLPDGIYPLPHFGLISISGRDAKSFLQGQITADMDSLEINNCCLGAHCNAKGRMYSNFLLNRQAAEQYLLQMPVSNIAGALKALKKYAVFSSVDIVDLSNEFICFGLGGGPHGTLKKMIADEESLLIETAHVGGYQWLPLNAITQLLDRKTQGPLFPEMEWQGSAIWELKTIRSGLVFIVDSLSEEYIPQMINFDCLDGISFEKGCYTGQEIIARMKYRGKVKRRMRRFCATADKIAPGDTIIDDGGKSTGSIVSAVATELSPDRNNVWEGLAVLPQNVSEQTPLYLGVNADCDSARVTLLELPYAIPE